MRGRSAAVALLATILALALGTAARGVEASGASAPRQIDRQLTLSLRGSLTVSFHGDRAAGCAARGVCGYAGTIVVGGLPGRISADIAQFTGGGGGFFGGIFAGQGGYVAARVTSPTGVCTDAAADPDPADISTPSGRLRIVPIAISSSELSTRCAGPLDADLVGVAPSVTLAGLGALSRGKVLDLSGTRRFSSHGFSGTMRSSIVMRILSVTNASLNPAAGLGGSRRILAIDYALNRVTGRIASSFAGVADPRACRLLDSCGAHGSSTVAFGSRGASFIVYALAGPKRPWRDLRAALGLGGRGNPRGVQVTGGLEMQEGQTTTVVGGCHDGAPEPFGGVTLIGSAGRLRAVAFPVPQRTRCPGPLASVEVAAGAFPLSDLGRRHLRLTLHGSAPFTDDGYTGTDSARFTVVLTRRRILRNRIPLRAGATGFVFTAAG